MNETDIPHVQRIARKTWHATYENLIPLAEQNNFLKVHYGVESLKLRLGRSIMYVAELKEPSPVLPDFPR
jgi:hypothetical protein